MGIFLRMVNEKAYEMNKNIALGLFLQTKEIAFLRLQNLRQFDIYKMSLVVKTTAKLQVQNIIITYLFE